LVQFYAKTVQGFIMKIACLNIKRSPLKIRRLLTSFEFMEKEVKWYTVNERQYQLYKESSGH